MQNHTATHLMNRVLHSLLPVTCQRSSHVTADPLRLDFSAFQVSNYRYRFIVIVIRNAGQ